MEETITKQEVRDVLTKHIGSHSFNTDDAIEEIWKELDLGDE